MKTPLLMMAPASAATTFSSAFPHLLLYDYIWVVIIATSSSLLRLDRAAETIDDFTKKLLVVLFSSFQLTAITLPNCGTWRYVAVRYKLLVATIIVYIYFRRSGFLIFKSLLAAVASFSREVVVARVIARTVYLSYSPVPPRASKADTPVGTAQPVV